VHSTSEKLMGYFVDKYLNGKSGVVVDVGSYDVNGNHRSLFDRDAWNYVGIDIRYGPCVDIVLEDPYNWKIPDNRVDVVISDQTFEHIEYPEKTMLEIARILKPESYCCIIAPTEGDPHDYPKWYGNMSKEKFIELAEGAGLEVVECFVSPTPYRMIREDGFLVAMKGAQNESIDRGN